NDSQGPSGIQHRRGNASVEHGGLLPLLELWLSAASVGGQRFGSEGCAFGLQSGLCENPKSFQLQHVVRGPEARSQLRNERSHAVLEGRWQRSRLDVEPG